VLYRISQTDNTSYAGTKANYNACFYRANCSTIFSPAYFVIFSDEFKFTYKTVSFSQTKHLAVAPFPMMLLGFVWFKSFGSACRNDGLRQGCSEFQFRQYRLAVLGGWFRLGENIRNVWDP
jgi:hypothetical protein